MKQRGNVVALDSLEALLHYDQRSGACSLRNMYLLKELLSSLPATGASVVASTCALEGVNHLGLGGCFDMVVEVPRVGQTEASLILKHAGFGEEVQSDAWKHIDGPYTSTTGVPIGTILRTCNFIQTNHTHSSNDTSFEGKENTVY
eukprot:TRINITY_DN2731_c0_g1_i4.p1 TRINITY_DN2731_c0_g1~~TRINITY_DN2731_c0_g1_i4.p1  ORF type:complete len:146 (-),score=11.46 TRINITY_DN2731_c0_g1_i4:151-588(-)